MSSNNQTFSKKSYQSPKLVVYGDIRQLTTSNNIPTSPYRDTTAITSNPNNKTNYSP